MSADDRADWVDVLRNHIRKELADHGALAFYGVILEKGGKGHSIMLGHPELPVQHVYDHVLQCLNEDIALEALR